MSIDESLSARLAQEEDGPELDAVRRLLEEADRSTNEAVSERTSRTDEAWRELSARIADDSASVRGGADVLELPTAARPNATTARRARWPLQVAASFLLCGSGVGAWYSVPVSHVAPAGGQHVVALGDGSTVTLNAGSELTLRRSFALFPGVPASTRSVELVGEAFFDVASESRPFEVSTAGAEIRVLGTRFNVRARSEGVPSVSVAVEEGSVSVTPSSDGSEDRDGYVLGAGESVRVDDGSVLAGVESVRPDRIAAWRTGGLMMVDVSLAQIVREVGLRLDAHVTLSGALAAGPRMSVFYSQLGDLDSVLADLATQQGLRYRQTASGWEIF